MGSCITRVNDEKLCSVFARDQVHLSLLPPNKIIELITPQSLHFLSIKQQLHTHKMLKCYCNNSPGSSNVQCTWPQRLQFGASIEELKKNNNNKKKTQKIIQVSKPALKIIYRTLRSFRLLRKVFHCHLVTSPAWHGRNGHYHTPTWRTKDKTSKYYFLMAE